MREKASKILNIIALILVVGVSVIIFLKRDMLADLQTYGYAGVILLCFIANATVLLPAPSLMVVTAAALVYDPWIVGLCGAVGTTLGECVGFFFGDRVAALKNPTERKVYDFVSKYGCVAVGIFAVLPLPLFDIAGIAAGAMGMKWYKFVISCFIGKLIKTTAFALMSGMIYEYVT